MTRTPAAPIDDGANAGLPELSVPHTNLVPQTPSAGPCPESIWDVGFTSGIDGAGYGLVRVESQPPRVFLETYDEDGTLRYSLMLELPLYTLSVNTDGQGMVTTEPNLAAYVNGTPVELTANAEPGWMFDHWEGDLTGSTNPDALLMDGPKTVTAVFVADQYSLTVNVTGQGTVALDPNDGTYTYGQNVTLTANAEPGWTFDHWEGGPGRLDEPRCPADGWPQDGHRRLCCRRIFAHCERYRPRHGCARSE